MGEGTLGAKQLWMERLYTWLGMPFWVGALVFGAGIFVALLLWAMIWSGAWTWFLTSGLLVSIPIFAAVGVYTQFAARSVRRGVEHLEARTRAMRRGEDLRLGPMYSVPLTFAFYAGLTALIQPLYIVFGLPGIFSLEQRVIQSLPYIYWNLFVNTFVWVLLYAILAIVRVGRMELTLRPFTEDRSLGLKPLGRLALKASGLYLLFVALIVVPNVLSGFLAIPLLLFFTAMSLLALAIFFLPLLPLRAKLSEAKAKLVARIGPRYTRVFERIDREEGGPVSQSDVNELTALEKIRRDVQEIYAWPFDTGVVVRLSVIVFSVTAIVAARIIASLLGF